MALTQEQLATADAVIADVLLSPLRDMGIRLTMGAISHGPLSRGEFHFYSPNSAWGIPQIDTLNMAPTQTRTVRWEGVLSLKDLRDTNAGRNIVEQVIALVEGAAPFGFQMGRPYDGRLYPRSCQLARENQPSSQRQNQGPESRLWIYALVFECQINNVLPPL